MRRLVLLVVPIAVAAACGSFEAELSSPAPAPDAGTIASSTSSSGSASSTSSTGGVEDAAPPPVAGGLVQSVFHVRSNASPFTVDFDRPLTVGNTVIIAIANSGTDAPSRVTAGVSALAHEKKTNPLAVSVWSARVEGVTTSVTVVYDSPPPDDIGLTLTEWLGVTPPVTKFVITSGDDMVARAGPLNVRGLLLAVTAIKKPRHPGPPSDGFSLIEDGVFGQTAMAVAYTFALEGTQRDTSWPLPEQAAWAAVMVALPAP